MFNSSQGGSASRNNAQVSGVPSHNSSGSALQAASAKMKRKQISPKAAMGVHEAPGSKSPTASGASPALKYA